MSTPTPERALEDATVFSALDTQQLAIVSKNMRRRALAAGEVLFTQGQQGQSLVVVLEGRLDVRVRLGGGDVAICPLFASDLVGEMACLDPAPRSATVVAAERTRIAELDRKTLSSIWRHAPIVGARLVKGIARTVSSRLRDTDRRIELTVAHLAGHAPTEDTDLLGERRPSTRELKKRPKPSTPWRGIDVDALSDASGLSADAIEALKEITEVVSWKPGAPLFEEGEPGSDCVLVARGEVEIVKAVDRTSRVVAVLGPGTLVGQLALVDGEARSASVRARGKVVGMRLDRAEFSALLSRGDPLGARLLTLVAVATVRQLRMATRRLAQLRAARERLTAEQAEHNAAAVERRARRAVEPQREPKAKPPAPKNAWERALAGSGVSLDMLDQIEVTAHKGQLGPQQLNTKNRLR